MGILNKFINSLLTARAPIAENKDFIYINIASLPISQTLVAFAILRVAFIISAI